MRHDFFVHADLLTTLEKSTHKYSEYSARIFQIAKNSSRPILVSSSGSLTDVIPKGRSISTICYQLEDTGKIPKSEADRLKAMLGGFNINDEFRIHGAYFGRCIAEFATQLFGLVYKGEYWPDYPRPIIGEDRNAAARQQYYERIASLLDAQEFQRANIKYGVVFDKKVCPLFSLGHSRKYELATQLSDRETEIF